MKSAVTLLLLLLGVVNNTNAMEIDRFQEPGYGFRATGSKNWIQSRQTKTFDNQGDMHSEYLTLNPDGSFVFVGHYEPWNGFSAGRWKKTGKNKIVLNWNPRETEKVVNNADSCSKYEIRNYSHSFRILDWILLIKKDSLITAGFEGNVKNTIDQIEKLIPGIDSLNLKTEIRISAMMTPRGDSIGKRTEHYFFDSSNRVRKYISESLYIKADGTEKRSFYLVYFVHPDLIRTIYTSGDNNKSQPTYFSGQKLVQSPNARDAAFAFEHLAVIREEKPDTDK